MSSGRGGGGSNSNGGGVGSIPAASKKMVQSLKEIVNCPEVEIYAMLKECNMDPNEAVNRLLSQDPFHEVKSKREKKKENKDVGDLRSRGASSTSTCGGRGGADRYPSRGSTALYGASDSGSSRGKPAYKKDNGPATYASPAVGTGGNNMNRQQPPLSESNMDKAFPVFTAENTSATSASSGFQSAWAGMPGQVSMADIVKMGRPHAKASGGLNTSQQHFNNQHMVASVMPAPDHLHPSQNSVKLSDLSRDSGVTGSQHVPPNDDWHLEEEPLAASVSSIVELSVDSEPYVDHYDRTKQQFRSQSDDVRFPEDDAGDSAHVDLSVPGHQNIHEDNSGSASGFDNDLYQNINSYQVDNEEVEDTSVSISSATTNLQKLALLEDEDSASAEDGPAVKIPDHLQVLSADCSHLSFGTFGSGMGGPFSGSVPSRPVKNDEEVVPTADTTPPVGQPETRNTEEYEDEHLRTTADENAAHRMGANSGNYDATSVSQADVLKQEVPEVPQGNQYSYPSPAANYGFENSQQLNTSFANSQTSSQMQGLPSLLPYSNSLPGTLLAANVQQQPLREPELAYSPFPISQSTQAKCNNSVSSISGPTASMAEALKTAAAQPNQSLPGGSVSGGPAPQQHLAVHPYSEPSLMGHFANMILPQSYPMLHQSYTYMPSGFQQFAAAGNSSYPQSLAAMLPQYKNSVSVSSLPQSVAVAPGYGAFGNSNSIPSNLPLNPPTAPASTSTNYDDVLSSQYKDASHLLSLQQGPGSRMMSGVPGSTYYSFQGQSQQQPAAAFRQNQLPSQHYGPLSGYPNFYHSQSGPTLEQQLQMSRDGSLGGSQGQQQPKQSPQQLWQNSY